SHAPPAGQPSEGDEDPITLTALSSVVSTLVQKVHSLKAELHDHKRFFKDVVRKLVKKVKTLEVKLKTKKRKTVVSDSDQEDDNTQDVNLDALRVLANAAVADDSNILSAVPSGTSAVPAAALAVPFGTSAVPPAASTVSAGSPNRPGPKLEEPFTKKPKSPEAPTPSMPEVPISPAVTSPPSSRTQRKSLGLKHIHKPKSTLPTLDLDATAQTFLKLVVDEYSDDEDYVDEVWSVVVGWEILPTPLGEINALYRIDGGKGSSVLKNQHLWEIQSWRLYTLSNVHVLETISGEVLSMFTDVSYPLSVELIKKMLLHKVRD
nr:hypothetical protein [Tanacetum cinerariifolium]